MPLPDLRVRVDVPEQMDDYAITDARLTGALRDLRWTNRLLGGYRASRAVLTPLFQRVDRCRVLDLGTGDGEFVADLVRYGPRWGCHTEVVGIDANSATVDYARQTLDDTLPPTLRRRATIRTADALSIDVANGAFDVAHASLFLHHFFGNDLIRVLREMHRVSRWGILVNDLHRHPLAYAGIVLLASLLPVSAMYRHDAPASVRRGFRRAELHSLVQAAGLPPATIRWHWAFRWTADTIDLDRFDDSVISTRVSARAGSDARSLG